MIETKRRSLILDIVLAIIILIVGFLFWPGKEKFNQSNPRDINKNQIRVLVKALNIRKEPTIESKDIGTVYLGEIFTVLEHIDKDDYYWYKIKTKQGITGYIASDRNNEFVEVISGIIDRENPVITSKHNVIVFVDEKENYDDIECTDNSGKCDLTYEKTDDGFINVKGIDESGNESFYQIKYYDAYSLNSLFNDKSDNIDLTVTKKDTSSNSIINAGFIANKDVLNQNISKNYLPVIDYYDEEFNEIDNIHTLINKQQLSGLCINDEKNTIKDEYIADDILEGSMLCINYTFEDKDSKIKYVAIGFKGLENSDNPDNYLSNYYSKYFIIK